MPGGCDGRHLDGRRRRRHITVTAVADADVVNRAPGLAEDLRFDDAESRGLDGHGARRDTDDGGLQVELDPHICQS